MNYLLLLNLIIIFLITSSSSSSSSILLHNNNKFIKADDNSFLKQPENATLSVGKRLLLRCKPNLTNYIRNLNEKNINLVQYQWFKDNQSVIYNSNTNLYKDGSLEIVKVTQKDTGSYRCVAKYRSIIYNSQSAHIKVLNDENFEDHTKFYTTSFSSSSKQIPKEPPKFYIWPEDRNVVENDEVIFECQAANDASFVTSDNNSLNSYLHFYKYKWLKDGVALDLKSKNNNRIKLVQGVNLKIEKLKDTDAGSYTCRICNWNRDMNSIDTDLYDHKINSLSDDFSSKNFERDDCDERSSILKVLVAPRFIKRPSNMNVTLKSDAELECSAYGIPTPTIQWFKNGEPIYPSEYFQFNPNQGNLKILGIISQDEGYYQCLASNELNTIQSIAQLTVLTDDYSSTNSAGGEISQYDDYDILDKKTSTTSTTKKTILTTSSIDAVHLSAPINLKVLKQKSRSINIEWEKPSIIRNSTSTLIYSISWKAKNMDRAREINTTQTSMIIDDLLPDTIYVIEVCAMIGYTFKGPYASLEVKTDQEASLPGPPIDFQAEFVQDDDVENKILKLKWKKPVINANNIISYRLYYQHLHFGPINNQDETASSSSSSNEETVSSEYQDDESSNQLLLEEDTSEKYIDIDLSSETINGNYEHLIDDLLKYSTYKFKLIAVDNKNAKNDSLTDLVNAAEILIETPSDVPDGPPENIQIEILNTTSIMVQWDLPSMEKRNGLIVGYKIAVKENDKQLWNSNVDSEPRRKVISGLLPGHKYSVRVIAKTINGSGPASEWFIAETFSHEMDESRVPGQPLDLLADPTDKTIVIKWIPPSDSNRTLIRKYLLRYGIGFPDNEIELPGNRNSFIIENLIPSSQYVISLKAINNAGFGMEILKDVVTKRKSALGENENLYPPLNVQAVAISSQSIEIRWTDWHLKPDEMIPDDRYYSVRYSVAAEDSKYKYKNATERNVIITDLKPNTLYDFSVRLVIGRRESEWSMTTSQMTMETSPAPRDITIKSDPNLPNTVILTWSPPLFPPNTIDTSSLIPTGYIIYYLDENTFKQNSNHKWKIEYLQTSNPTMKLKHSIRKLKLETVYYFKIQSRNNRAYGASSPLIIFKTPNIKGEGGGKIFMPNEFSSSSNSDYYNSDPSIVLNSIQTKSNRSTILTEMNLIWIIIISVSSLFILVFILFAIFMCKRNTNSKKRNAKKAKEMASLSNTLNRQSNLNASTRTRNPKFAAAMSDPYDMNSSPNDLIEEDDTESTYIKTQQQQKLLLQQSTNSTTSTLIKHHQQHKTPSHHPLLINNPNHLVLGHQHQMSINNSANTTSNNVDLEFYSNMTATTQQIFTNNSDMIYNNHNNNESASQHIMNNNRTSSFNEDNFSQTGGCDTNDINTATAALAAANAAFNAPIFNNVNNNTNDSASFLRHTTRPKPIAIPLGNTNNMSNSTINQLDSPLSCNNTNNNINNNNSNNIFSLSNNSSQRKSFKNLPMATATLISSNAQHNSNVNNFNSINFNEVKHANKLHYTARPYIIDNQVQSNNDYSINSNHSAHSPASSCHSSGQPQVYDKIGNVLTSTTNINNKNLLQPLKSFGAGNNNNNNNNNTNNSMLPPPPPSSISIPNTPAKYCTESNFGNIRSPVKKQLLVSLAPNQTNHQTNITRGSGYNLNNKSSDVLAMIGRSNENLFERKLSTVNFNNTNNNNEELTAEMANLEGIMKDLNAITAQQFEC